MSKIEAELQKALNLKTKRNEDKQDYMARLVEGVNDADDDTYNGLSKEALDWFNDACDSIEGKKDIPDFPDAKVEAKEETSSRSRRGAAKDEAKEDEAKDAKPKRAASGATARMRELMTESLKEDGKLITREALSKAITKEGLEFKENTLDLVHTAFSQVVNMLADAKLLKLK